MKAQKDCFECLKNQARVHGVEMDKYCTFLDEIPKNEDGESLKLSPPQIAIELYGKIAQDLGVEDPYAHIKTQSIQKAFELIQSLEVENLNLQEAIRLSALGNVIDYGSESVFCIQSFDFIRALEHLEFALFELEKFENALDGAKNLVMLGDNAGENLFDEVLLRTLKKEYPSLKLYYFVRGEPIINDITLRDLQIHDECRGIFEVAQVVDSGVRSAGFVYEDASLEAREIFDRADVILSKGMGNFECLDEREDQRIFYLLKIKCQVVAMRLGFALGKMVFGQNKFFL